jgi:hypothetical protein
MPTKDKRVDAYIAAAPDFAKPILVHIRAVVHEGCPEIEETIKWGFPNFEHKGILCNMAAFKAHVSLGFWKHKLVMGTARPEDGMGSLGRLTAMSDLPSRRQLVALVKKAAELNEQGIKPVRPKKAPKAPLPTPPALAAALAKNKKARAAFDAFPPGHRREYIQWIVEAKTDATRDRRIAQAVEWMAEGKARNWKYM